MKKEELVSYVSEVYSVEPDYPFDEDETFVFRHTGNRKWFGIVMSVSCQKLGLARSGMADVVNLKCGPQLMGVYRRQPGILRCYHMNKDNWVTVLLDGTAEDETIKELLALSYALTDRPGR